MGREIAVLMLVLAIGFLNLGLGFACAILLEQPGALMWLRVPIRMAGGWRPSARPQPGPTATGSGPAAEQSDTASPDPATATSPTIPVAGPEVDWSLLPPHWVARLRSQQVVPRSLIEAGLWAIRCELPEYLQKLVEASHEHVHAIQGSDSAQQVRQSVYAWEQKVTEWLELLNSHEGVPPNQEIRHALRTLLENEAAIVQNAMRELEGENASSGSEDRALVGRMLSRVLKSTHRLRDSLDATLSHVLAREQRLGDLPNTFQTDPASGLINRLGLSVLAHEWESKDPHRVRLVSGILIDVDRFHVVNERYGHDAGDAVAAAIGRFLPGLIRKERGFDRVARVSGQRFLLFFGDTASRNATMGAERIRQCVEAAAFKLGSTTIPITISLAVSEWNKHESFEAWLDRVHLVLSKAKSGGGNCTCVGDENGLRLVTPSHYSVPVQDVVIGSD